MSQLLDRLLAQLSDPAELSQVLAPAVDGTHSRVRALLAAAFDFPFATLHDILKVEVLRTEIERPLFPLQRRIGAWTQTVPMYVRTDVSYEEPDLARPVWIDLSAEVALTLLLEMDAGQVESMVTREVSGFKTLAEFKARFRILDLDVFMKQLGIKTLEELQERYHYLLTEIKLRTPDQFDPNDPANQYRQVLNLAVFVRDTLDVTATLRDVKLARALAERTIAFTRADGQSETRTPYAPLVVFPDSALTGSSFSAASLQAFFGREGILALTMTPA